MTSRSAHQTSSSDILVLITEFYCGLTVKKSMQNISCQIRQFVMINEKIKNKDQTAKKILDFFLKIQQKLVKRTEKQWDQTFQTSIARAQALLRICVFPNRHLLIHSFKNIKTLTKFEFHSQRKTICSFRTEQATQQYNTIQVQKDIKVKTLYFFKWCQYVQKAKIVKQLKNREVQNQKISLSFNKYALKFNYFVAWKKFYKKQKLQRERSKTIQTRYRDKLLRKCMNTVLEISSIIGVQHQISDKITKKMVEYQKKKLLKKLKTNNQIIKNRIKYKKLNNIKVFQFIQMYQGRFKPLMNKSFQLARQKFQKQLQKTIAHKYFNQLIKFNKDRKDKVKKLLEFRRNSLFLFWRRKYISLTCFQGKQTQIASYLYKRRRNMVITILNFNKLVREQQFNKLQSMRQNPLTNRSFIQVKIKKQNQQKKKKLNQYLMQNFLQQLMEKLRNYQQSCYKRINDDNNTRLLSLKRLINRSNQNKKKLGQKQKYYKNLSKKHQKKILFSSFKRWRRIKYYQKIEEANIMIIQKCFKKIAVKLFWNKFAFRVKQKQCVAKLVDASNLALIRLAYLKILGRTNIINDTIKTMKQNRDRKLMRNLFQLLIRNQRFNSQRALQIQKYQGKRCQKLLIKRLKQQINFKNKTIRATNASYYRRKIQFIKRLKEQSVQARKLVQKAQKVSKSTFIRCFKKSVEQNIRVKQYINQKAGHIEQRLSQLSMNRFIRLLKHNKSGKQGIQLRKDKILFKISRTAILRIKLINQRIKNYKKLKLQQKLLVKRRIIDCVKLFGLQNKYKKLKAVIQQTKMKSAMKDLNQLCLAASKIKRCSLRQHQGLFIRRTAEFYSCLIKQKQQSEQKMMNIQQCLSKKTKGRIKYFFTLSKNNKQNNINIYNLSRLRKSKLFSQFRATCLRFKFYRIKFNCSLKFYAKNLMKKAFKSVKQTRMKIKQKQNMQRIDKNSSIMIERSIQKSFKSNSLSQQIQRFNLRKSRQIR